MNLFPKEKYFITLKNESANAILKLKNQTLTKEQYVSDWNKQTFIGKVENNEFEVKISNKIYGEFCLLIGKFNNNKGTIQIQITNTLKIIVILLIFSALLGVITSIIYNKPLEILYSILSILTTKFIFLDLGFRYFSKIGLKKLTEIVEVKEIKTTQK